ncbi:hypothetical protein [Pseudomonas reinekei]|uniref:Uncharacterized protein n=1 Tax=Pseudomonas reinekei TaxID=395598 RepID=A0A6H9R6A1_PSERE|nr:hypothetical protein [Pseudomonas reinekei]KAB0482023.1 hypothetical protein F7R15_24170 [Pseudomonas reinekei]
MNQSTPLPTFVAPSTPCHETQGDFGYPAKGKCFRFGLAWIVHYPNGGQLLALSLKVAQFILSRKIMHKRPFICRKFLK